LSIADGPGARTPAAEMTCKELVEVMTDYLDGALPHGDRIRFDAHLRRCPWCRNYLAQIQLTVHTLGSLALEPLAPEVSARLLEAFRDWRSAR
jgi:anti-sigma factor RsiW